MEETISLKEIFQTLRKRIVLILAFTVGATFISAVISYFYLTPVYQSSSQFIVNQKTQDPNVNYNVNDIRTNVEIINTYNVIIKSSAILDRVIDELDLEMTVKELEEKIEVSNAQNSQVVDVTVEDPDVVAATEIANTVVRVFQEQVPILMNVDNVQILTEAMVPANPQPVKPNPVLNMAIAFVLGAMIGVGLAFLLEYLDNTIKTEQDVEKYLDLPVLGVISQVTESDMRASSNPSARVSRKRGSTIGA